MDRIRRVLVVKRDRLSADAIAQTVRVAFPKAMVATASRLAEARQHLRDTPCDYLLSGARFSDGDVIDLVSGRTMDVSCPRRILVSTCSPQFHLLERLHALSVPGVFDAAQEEPEDFPFAVTGVSLGLQCWSDHLLRQLASGAADGLRSDRWLTLTEQLVLVMIGTGCDDRTAAERLELTPATVQSARRRLHAKLGVQHRGELVRLAAQHGYVRSGSDAMPRADFDGPLAVCRATSRREPATREPSVVAA